VQTMTDFDRLQQLTKEIEENRAGRYSAEGAAGLHERMGSNAARMGYYEGVHFEAIRAGLKCYQCLNPDCMAIFFSHDPEATCRACERNGLQYAVVAGEVTGSPCNSICTNATDAKCECSCGGANHGAKWLRGFTFPRNIEAHRRELRERRAARAEIEEAYDTDEHAAQVAKAASLREAFEDSLADAIEADVEHAEAMALALLCGPKPEPIYTKGGKKLAADQGYDLVVERTRIRRAYSVIDSEEPQLTLTCSDADGNRFWLRCKAWEWVKRTCDHGGRRYECSLCCYDPEITEGDFIRVKARKKSEDDGMTFLSHANVLVHCNPYGFILADRKEGLDDED
jgi:hypothetical protein